MNQRRIPKLAGVRRGTLVVGCVLLAAACGEDASGGPSVDAGVADGRVDATAPDDGGPSVDAGGEGDASVPDGGTPGACTPSEVPCVDTQILDLVLFEEASDASVENEELEDGSWRSVIDSSAGGLTPAESFVYVRFTDAGLERVDVSDVGAFESVGWDLAARRYLLRLNAGVSGPSCVVGARTAAETEFGALTDVPESLEFRTEAYYTTPSCELVPDGSGIGSPGTAISSFWSYRSCVSMTGNVYVIRLADGGHVKLEVETYYAPDVQAYCDETGMLPGGPSGSGHLTLRWAWID